MKLAWPLALTAYNHGAEGMRRATVQMGTDDIVKILRDYHGPAFGFASRNYYVSFLAALTVDRHPEQYFGPIPAGPKPEPMTTQNNRGEAMTPTTRAF